MAAIKVWYNGILFRSLLERNWAAYLDVTGQDWGYEVTSYETGGRPYLPDFELPASNMWVECKVPGDDTIKHALKAAAANQRNLLIAMPQGRFAHIPFCPEWENEHICEKRLITVCRVAFDRRGWLGVNTISRHCSSYYHYPDNVGGFIPCRINDDGIWGEDEVADNDVSAGWCGATTWRDRGFRALRYHDPELASVAHGELP